MKTALIEQHTAKENAVTWIDLDLLTKAAHVQVRTEQNPATVARYAEAYAAGEDMPPVIVFTEKISTACPTGYWLADGHHRVAGARKAKLAEIDAIVKKGDRRAAMLYAFSANHNNGLPLTNDDKRNAVDLLLADAEWRAWSDRAIAEACHVNPHLVAKRRAKLPTEQQSAQRKTKNGKVTDTTNIGKKAPAKQPAAHVDNTDPEPEELNFTNAAPSRSTASPSDRPIATVIKTTALAVDQSHANKILTATRAALANALDDGKHLWQGNDRQLVSLALVVGVPTGADPLTWSEAFTSTCYTMLADRLKTEVIDRLKHPDAHRLPSLATLAAWWGIDVRVLNAIAERKVG